MIPRCEYPNPQFERKDWLNLNGEWEFCIDMAKSGVERELFKAEKLDSKIIVPFCPESELSGIGNKDFMYCVWYRRTVDIPKEKLDERIFIHFGAVDYEASVYINGELAGTHKGGYTSFEFDITSLLKEGENVITVCAVDDTRDKLIPSGKQSGKYESYGCYYTRTTGIWQTVWLEFVPNNNIKSVKYYPDPDNSSVRIDAYVCGKGNFEAEAFFEGRSVGKASKITNDGFICVELSLSETHLWNVGEGNLYDLKLRFEEDTVYSYFGLRTVRLEGMKFLINGKSVFQRLVLDQGYYPDGIYTAPDEETLKRDIELSLAAGFNGARLHEKVFEPRFLYYCDKYGYLAWGEYPNWGLDHSRPDSVYSVLPEWIESINRDFNHPSIVGWCPFNETWDQQYHKVSDDVLYTVYSVTKQIDVTRPCIDTSGNFHYITDIFDVHDYEQNPEVFKEHYDKLMETGELYDMLEKRFVRKRQFYKGEPTFVSEYGGIPWIEDKKEGWGYGRMPSSHEEFLERYKGLTDALLDNDCMFGFCYTQLYDVEQEQNGLYTYYREPKFDINYFKEVNSRKAAIED